MNDAKSGTLADQVLAQLQHAIVTGELVAGSKINEQELAARYGVSRGPLREALQRLEQRRLVERIPHVGARIVSLTPQRLRDLYQVRAELEAMACRLAAQRITPAQIDALGQLLDRQHAVFSQGPVTGFKDDIDFHFGIIQASGNEILKTSLTGDLYHQLQMYRYQCSSGRRPLEALAEHRRILEAIAQGDGDLAAILMRRHIEAGARHTDTVLRTKMEEYTQ